MNDVAHSALRRARPIHVIFSEGQSQNPVKRKLETDIVAELVDTHHVEVMVIPNLYDLTPDGQSLTRLRELHGDLILLAWHYERAAHWMLDRHGICGRIGEIELKQIEDENEDDEDDENGKPEDETQEEEAKSRVVDARTLPDRQIYCLDLRVRNDAREFVSEVLRIAESREQRAESKTNGEQRAKSGEPEGADNSHLMQWIQGAAKPEQLERYLHTTRQGDSEMESDSGSPLSTLPSPLLKIDESPNRRWYPVIDYSRCTNCMECIDFCLFGVYGVDRVETILVEQPDNCRKGCPACSRVCPENAIIFPQHKTPSIAGAPSTDGIGLKIDLSQLFGAPNALEVAALERDEQLVAVGRDAVGLSVGMPKRQADKPNAPADDFDKMLDKLDDLDL